MGAYKVGQSVLYKGVLVAIVSIHKGGKTSTPNWHSGIIATGMCSNPCTYTLSTGERVRGNKLKK